jgi:hypothetical protein
MHKDQLKDLVEIRQMMRVGNQFNVVLRKLSEHQFILIFRVIGGSEFILCTQKLSDRVLKEKIFTNADATLLEVQRLKNDANFIERVRFVLVEFIPQSPII